MLDVPASSAITLKKLIIGDLVARPRKEWWVRQRPIADPNILVLGYIEQTDSSREFGRAFEQLRKAANLGREELAIMVNKTYTEQPNDTPKELFDLERSLLGNGDSFFHKLEAGRMRPSKACLEAALAAVETRKTRYPELVKLIQPVRDRSGFDFTLPEAKINEEVYLPNEFSRAEAKRQLGAQSSAKENWRIAQQKVAAHFSPETIIGLQRKVKAAGIKLPDNALDAILGTNNNLLQSNVKIAQRFMRDKTQDGFVQLLKLLKKSEEEIAQFRQHYAALHQELYTYYTAQGKEISPPMNGAEPGIKPKTTPPGDWFLDVPDDQEHPLFALGKALENRASTQSKTVQEILKSGARDAVEHQKKPNVKDIVQR